MYETFQTLLRLANTMGEVMNVEFNADHGDFHRKGIWISGVTADGESFTVSLECLKKVNPDA